MSDTTPGTATDTAKGIVQGTVKGTRTDTGKDAAQDTARGTTRDTPQDTTGATMPDTAHAAAKATGAGGFKLPRTGFSFSLSWANGMLWIAEYANGVERDEDGNVTGGKAADGYWYGYRLVGLE
jgi:hypothetical protein